MWLDDLNELVGRLKVRIEQHKDVLGKNETATRYALIDPLLTALGWDLSDPGQVQMEYNTGEGRADGYADYAMFARGDTDTPELVIEAKKLGTPISVGIDQSIGYCLKDDISYFVVTNGEKWEAYYIYKSGKLADKRVVDFSLTDPAQATVMKMLWLWRGNFESGSPIVPVAPDRLASQQTATPAPQPVPAESPPNVQRPNRGTPLGEFNPNKKDDPPTALLFSDGTEKEVTNWYEFQILVVEWLIKTGHLTKADCPVKGPKGGYLVNASPVSRNNKPFSEPKQVVDVWIDAAKDIPNHVRTTKNLLRARKVDLSHVRVVTKT